MTIPSLCSSLALLSSILVLYKTSSVYGNSEGDALYALKNQLKDPDNVMQSWDPTLVNPCSWYHVTCNDENSVTRIDLGNANLSGELVPQLGQLANLQFLEIFGNNITGIIPNEIGNLTNLLSLDLYLNRLHGYIPTTLGNLQKLIFLRLNDNALNGTIPYSLTTIATLQVIDLTNNSLSGYVPRNGSFALFSHLSFDNNPKLIFPEDVPVTPTSSPLNS
ncbi:uncharacterized protein LOC143542505 [Bidens hawaiensis]|uniref:uncharacterized protein LOC143542505 n=1 Tax=Bidens hawaiensis TaxID=980011 RepID=UPI004048F239